MNVQLELDLDPDDLTFDQWVRGLPLTPVRLPTSALGSSPLVTKPVEKSEGRNSLSRYNECRLGNRQKRGK